MAKLLSVIIPARNEEWLQQTIDDIFKNSELGDELEILVGDDASNEFAIAGHFQGFITYHAKVGDNWPKNWAKILSIHRVEVSVGQRAMQNELARMAKGKYLMKLDAHVSLSQGFDRVMLEIMEANPDIVLVPAFTNLHVYNWICPQGHKTYQGKVDKCSQCEETNLTKELVWKNNTKIYSDFKFNDELIFEYGNLENYDLFHEVAAIQGSGFMVSKDNYFKWNLIDESWGSWGSMGYEIWKKVQDNGGKTFVTRKAFMGHFFRKADEFPYERNDAQILGAYEKAKELAKNK